MKKKNGSILLFVLVCIGILGAMLITFLDTTTPKRVFYDSAVRSYGFLDDSQNLHGLLELETESVKNSTLAYIRGQTDLIYHCRPLIWNEKALDALKETLNKFQKEYWENAGENAIEDLWKIAKEAESKDSYDKTRKMYHNIPKTFGLSKWTDYKDQEEVMVKAILELTTKKDFTDENILNFLEELKKFNSFFYEEGFKSTEIEEIQKILNGVLENEYPQWQEIKEHLKQVARIMKKLKPPQEERFKELVSLKKIEQNLNSKTSIDANTWQEIKELLSIEKSLPQTDQGKKNFLKELAQLEQKFLSSHGQTQPQTFEEVDRIRSEISKIFQNSIADALEQENSANNGLSSDEALKQLEFDISASIEYQYERFTNSILQDILNSINDKDLIDKLKGLATDYDRRINDKNYQEMRNLIKKSNGFQEILTLDKDTDRLQSVLMVADIVDGWRLGTRTANQEKNFNVESVVGINILDNKLPLSRKFKSEVKEAIKLIFQTHGIYEGEIVPFLDDIERIIDVLGKPDSIQYNKPGLTPYDIISMKQELEYFRMVIEDFRETKRDLDVSIFKEFSSWKEIFRGKKSEVENNILKKMGSSLTFVNGIDSINFYAANEDVRLALMCALPLRPEISSQQKKDAKLPESKNPTIIRQKMQEIFDYGLKEGNNDQAKLEENRKTIRKILELLHEAKLVNFPEGSNGEIDVFCAYSKFMKITVTVRDRDYQLPLHRTTDYYWKIEYAGNGKLGGNNTIQTVEEF